MSWALRNNPRDWQIEALEAWWNNSRSGIAKVVTGGGKTYFAMMCIEHLRKRHSEVCFLVLVPTLALRDQWTLDIIEDLGVSRDEIYVHGVDRQLIPGNRIALMVINSARTHAEEITHGRKWMLIVDECHRAASMENRKALNGDWFATLGLSATPERQYDEWFEEILVPSIGTVIGNMTMSKQRETG